MENLLFLGVPILKHIRVDPVQTPHYVVSDLSFDPFTGFLLRMGQSSIVEGVMSVLSLRTRCRLSVCFCTRPLYLATKNFINSILQANSDGN